MVLSLEGFRRKRKYITFLRADYALISLVRVLDEESNRGSLCGNILTFIGRAESSLKFPAAEARSCQRTTEETQTKLSYSDCALYDRLIPSYTFVLSHTSIYFEV